MKLCSFWRSRQRCAMPWATAMALQRMLVLACKVTRTEGEEGVPHALGVLPPEQRRRCCMVRKEAQGCKG